MSGVTRGYTHPERGKESPPDYARLLLGMSDAELEEEILVGKGTDDYRYALVQEFERRARAGNPTTMEEQ